jgi:hypothetical protein
LTQKQQRVDVGKTVVAGDGYGIIVLVLTKESAQVKLNT